MEALLINSTYGAVIQEVAAVTSVTGRNIVIIVAAVY